MLNGSETGMLLAAAERESLLEGNAEIAFHVRAEIPCHQRRGKRSKPASTGVCVVNRLPARVTVRATSNG